MRTRFSDFELDPQRFLLERSGRRVALRPKVMDLLILLVENRERVVSREEIADALWAGMSVGGGSLSGLVNELRRALGERGNAASSIRTVHARGYQFTAPTREADPPPDASLLHRQRVETLERGARGARESWKPAMNPGILRRIEPILRPDRYGWKGARGILVEGPMRSGRSQFLAELLTYGSSLGFDVHVLVQSTPTRESTRVRRREVCDLMLDTLVEKAGRDAVECALPLRGRVLLDRSELVGRRLMSSPSGGLESRQDLEQAARWLSCALRRFSESAPLLIAADDLDRTDVESLEFLNALVSRLGDARIVFAATTEVRARVDDLKPCEMALDRLRRHQRIEAFPIQPLGKSELRSLLLARGIAPLPDELLDRLSSHCSQSPGADAMAADWLAQEGAADSRETPERRMRFVSAPQANSEVRARR